MVPMLIGLGLLAAVATGLLASVLPWPAESAGSHTPFHISCRHHDHGPSWHADHGRILGGAGSGAARQHGRRDPVGIEARSITAGRPPQGSP